MNGRKNLGETLYFNIIGFMSLGIGPLYPSFRSDVPIDKVANAAERAAGSALRDLTATFSPPLPSFITKAPFALPPYVPSSCPVKTSCKTFVSDPMYGIKRLALIAGDGFIGNTDLDGGNPAYTTRWLLDDMALCAPRLFAEHKGLIDDLEKLHKRSVAFEALADPTNLKQVSEQLIADIRALTAGQRVLIPGGWRGDPGHFILYEVVCEGTTYTFTIYNTGAGIGSFHDRIVGIAKPLYRSLMSYEKIPLDELLALEKPGMARDSIPFLIRFLLEVQIDTIEKPVDLLYTGIEILFKDYRKQGVTTEFVTPQRSGTCAFSSLLAYLRNYWQQKGLPIEAYKALVIEMKVKELIDARQRIADLAVPSEDGLQARTLLEQTALFLEKRLTRMLQKEALLPPLSKERLLALLSSVIWVHEDVKTAKKEAEIAFQALTVPLPVLPPPPKGSMTQTVMAPSSAPKVSTRAKDFPFLPTTCSSISDIEKLLSFPLAGFNFTIKEGLFITLIRALPEADSLQNLLEKADLSGEKALAIMDAAHKFWISSVDVRGPERDKTERVPYSTNAKLALCKLYIFQNVLALWVDKKQKAAGLRYADLDRYSVFNGVVDNKLLADITRTHIPEEKLLKVDKEPAPITLDRLGVYSKTQVDQLRTILSYFRQRNQIMYPEEACVEKRIKNPKKSTDAFYQVLFNRYPHLRAFFERKAEQDYDRELPRDVQARRLASEDINFYIGEEDPFKQLHHLQHIKCLALVVESVFLRQGYVHFRSFLEVGLSVEEHPYSTTLFPQIFRDLCKLYAYYDFRGQTEKMILRDLPVTCRRIYRTDSVPVINHDYDAQLIKLPKNIIFRELYRATSAGAPSLMRPYLLAALANEPYRLISFPALSEWFTFLFFYGKQSTPDFSDPVQRALVKELKQKGVALFLKYQPKTKPQLKPLLFVLSLALAVRLWDSETGSKSSDSVAETLQMLLTHYDSYENPPQGTYYFLVGLTLLSKIIEQRDQIEDILSLWFVWNTEGKKSNGDFTETYLNGVILDKMMPLLDEVNHKLSRKNSAELMHWASIIFQKIPGLSAADCPPTEEAEATFSGGLLSLGSHHLDFLEGTYALPRKDTKDMTLPLWAVDKKFTLFFGPGRYAFFNRTPAEGDPFVYFEIPGQGAFEYRTKQGKNNYEDKVFWPICLFMPWNKGSYQYVSPENNRHLPHALVYDCRHWKGPEGLLICRKKDNHPFALVYSESPLLIKALDRSEGEMMVFFKSDEENFLSRFDDPSFIITTWQKDILQTVRFKRFLYQEQPLAFHREGGHLVADFDPHYTLREPVPQGLFDNSFENYFVLDRKDEPSKSEVIVPCVVVERSSRFGGIAHIQRIVPQPLEKNVDLETSEENTRQCFCYSYDGVDLKAKTQAGHFFLGHIAYKGGHYEKAFDLLADLSPSEPFATDALSILRLYLYGRKRDIHPNALACFLKAAFLLVKKEIVMTKEEKQNLLEGIESYLSSYAKVDQRLRLPDHELSTLLQLFKTNELCATYLRYLAEGCWPQQIVSPEGKIYELSFSLRDWKSYASDSFFKNSLSNLLFEIQSLEPSIMVNDERYTPSTVTPGSFAASFLPSYSPPPKDYIFTHIRTEDWGSLLPRVASVVERREPIPLKLLRFQLWSYLTNSRAVLGSSRHEWVKILFLATIHPETIGAALIPFSRSKEKYSFLRLLDTVKDEIFKTREGPTSESLREPVLLEAPVIPKKEAALHTFPPLTSISTAIKSPFVRVMREGAAPTALKVPSLKGDELRFEASVKRGIAFYNQAMQKAAKEEGHYELKGDTELLRRELVDLQKTLQGHIAEKEPALVEYANKITSASEIADFQSGRRTPLDKETLYWLFAKGNPEEFVKANPHLQGHTTPLIQQIYECLQLTTDEQHIARILAEWPEHFGENEIQKIGAMVTAEKSDKPHFLVYEYFAGLRLWPRQKELLNELSGHKTGQLIMGGGKTKVISALDLYRATKPGELALLVVPGTLFNSVFNDLKKTMKRAFNSQVVTWEFSREALTEEKVQALLMEMQIAMRTGQIILVKPETIHILGLEFFFKANVGAAGLKELGAIIDAVHNKTHAILDESHLILDQKQETNYSIGDLYPVKGKYVDIVGSLLEYLTSLSLGGLDLVSEEVWREKVVPALVDYFLKTTLSEERVEAKNYLLGKDPAYEKKLASYFNNGPETKELANFLSLGRYLINDLFPKAFKKHHNRHYGRLPPEMAKTTDQAYKTVPYLGVGAPATTVFANWAEELTYGFLTAMASSPPFAMVQFVVQSLINQATILNKAESADREFSDLFGVTLSSLSDDKTLADFVASCEDDVIKRLRLQSAFMKLTVTFLPDRLSRNPQDFFFASSVALSGTPYNSACYPQKMGEGDNLIKDDSDEGRILTALIKKAQKNSDFIRKVASTKPYEMLTELVRNHPQKTRIRGLQDPGALLKEVENLAVAEAANKVIEEQGLALEGTLFFWKKPGMVAADQLAFLPLKGPLRFIEGTNKSDLLAAGIGNVFIYFDERKTTGTDLPQPPEALNFCTIDVGQNIVSLEQSVLRLRGFLTDQDVELVVAGERSAHLPSTVPELIADFIKNLAITQSNQYVAALRKRIDAAFKKAAFEILKETPEPYEKLKVFFITRSAIDPFIAFGQTPQMVKPINQLKHYLEEQEALYAGMGLPMSPFLKAELHEIRKTLDQDPGLLPSAIPAPIVKDEGQEVHVEAQQEVAAQTTAEQEKVLELALETELKAFPEINYDEVDKELPFDLAGFIDGTNRPSSLMAILASRPDARRASFSSDIYVGPSFINEKVSLFHESQLPAKQILVYERTPGAFEFVFLTLAQAEVAKQQLSGRQNPFLVDDRGRPLTQIPKRLQEVLLEAAIYRGDAYYLQLHREEAARLFNESRGEKLRFFLSLRALQDPDWKALVLKDSLFTGSTSDVGRKIRLWPGYAAAPLIQTVTRPLLMPPVLPPAPLTSKSFASRLGRGLALVLLLPFMPFALLFTALFSRLTLRRLLDWVKWPFV